MYLLKHNCRAQGLEKSPPLKAEASSMRLHGPLEIVGQSFLRVFLSVVEARREGLRKRPVKVFVWGCVGCCTCFRIVSAAV